MTKPKLRKIHKEEWIGSRRLILAVTINGTFMVSMMTGNVSYNSVRYFRHLPEAERVYFEMRDRMMRQLALDALGVPTTAEDWL